MKHFLKKITFFCLCGFLFSSFSVFAHPSFKKEKMIFKMKQTTIFSQIIEIMLLKNHMLLLKQKAHQIQLLNSQKKHFYSKFYLDLKHSLFYQENVFLKNHITFYVRYLKKFFKKIPFLKIQHLSAIKNLLNKIDLDLRKKQKNTLRPVANSALFSLINKLQKNLALFYQTFLQALPEKIKLFYVFSILKIKLATLKKFSFTPNVFYGANFYQLFKDFSFFSSHPTSELENKTKAAYLILKKNSLALAYYLNWKNRTMLLQNLIIKISPTLFPYLHDQTPQSSLKIPTIGPSYQNPIPSLLPLIRWVKKMTFVLAPIRVKYLLLKEHF